MKYKIAENNGKMRLDIFFEIYNKIGVIILVIAGVFVFANSDKIKCESEDGKKWEKVGKAQIEICVQHYSDAGKSCENSSECQGNCVQKNMDSKPFCEQSDNRFGCGNTVENIKAGEGILCID